MTIGIKINLPLEDKFNLLIKSRINNSYVNDGGDIISIYSSSELINKELLKKGIEYGNKSIEDLILEVHELSIQRVSEPDGRRDWEELEILKSCILEVAFYIYDYQYDKMTIALKNEFKNIRQFSNLLRKNKFNF